MPRKYPFTAIFRLLIQYCRLVFRRKKKKISFSDVLKAFEPGASEVANKLEGSVKIEQRSDK